MKLIDQKILILDVRNPNGRIYTTETAGEIIRQKRQILGSLGMSKEGSFDLSKTSHICENLMIKGGWLVGTIRVLDTEYGKTLRTLLQAEVRLDFRVVGFGNLSEDGTITNFELVSINAVNEGA